MPISVPRSTRNMKSIRVLLHALGGRAENVFIAQTSKGRPWGEVVVPQCSTVPVKWSVSCPVAAATIVAMCVIQQTTGRWMALLHTTGMP